MRTTTTILLVFRDNVEDAFSSGNQLDWTYQDTQHRVTSSEQTWPSESIKIFTFYWDGSKATCTEYGLLDLQLNRVGVLISVILNSTQHVLYKSLQQGQQETRPNCSLLSEILHQHPEDLISCAGPANHGVFICGLTRLVTTWWWRLYRGDSLKWSAWGLVLSIVRLTVNTCSGSYNLNRWLLEEGCLKFCSYKMSYKWIDCPRLSAGFDFNVSNQVLTPSSCSPNQSILSIFFTYSGHVVLCGMKLPFR